MAENWASPVSGNWSNGALWGGTAPGPGDAATIAATGSYTVKVTAPATAASLLLDDAGGTLGLASALASGGAVDIAAGTLDLAAGGTLAGGTLETTGGVVLAQGGTLAGVQVRGPLDLDAAGAALALIGPSSLVGASGGGAGTILLGGDAAALTLSGTETLAATTIDIGGADETSMMLVTDPHGAGTTLTLGPATLVQQTGLYAAMFTSVTAGDAVDNLGTITADVAGGRFGASGGALVNTGLMSAAGGTLVVAFRHLENDGTIAVGAGGLVELGAANAAYAGSGTLLVTGGTLALEGEVSLPEIGAVRQTGGVLLIDGSLGLAGGTLALPAGIAAGEWQLGGTIAGGTISDPGGLLGIAPGTNGAGGTLDGVTWVGTLALAGAGETLTALDGLAMLNAAGTAPGTIAVSGSGAALDLGLSQTLDAATLDLGSDGSAAAALVGTDPFESTGMTITLGAALAVQQTGTLALIAAAATEGDALVNLGRIAAAFAGGTLTLGGAEFVNQGTIEIGAGETAIVAADSFDNSGRVQVDAGGTVELGTGAWSNEGSIVAAGGTVMLTGAIAAAAPAAITETGGAVDLAGTLALAGATLAAGRGTGRSYVLSGEIDGGTLSDGGFGVSYQEAAGGPLPLLDGVTVWGTLGLGAAGSALGIEGPFAIAGLSGTGQGSIDLSGAGATLEAEGNLTIDTASLGIGSATGSTLTTAGLADPATLTLGPGLHVAQGSTIAELLAAGADTILNLGSIAAFVVHGGFAVAGNGFINAGAISVGNNDRLSITTAQFRNTGTIAASGNGVVAVGTAGATWSSTGTISETGGVLDLGGSFGLADIGTVQRSGGIVDVLGTLTDSGGVLAVGAGSALGTLLLQGKIVSGTIEDGGGGLAFSGAGTLAGVTYQGLLDLSTAGATLDLQSGFVMTGPGGTAATIDVLGAGDALQFRDSQALNNVTVVLGNASQAASLAFIDTQTGGETLRLGATTSVVQQAGGADILGGAQSGDSIVNSGTIVADVPGAALAIYGGSFNNVGTITVANAGTLIAQPRTLANLAAGTLAGGTWQVGAGATLILPDNAAVATDAASITLGAGASIAWLSSATFQTIPLAATLGTIAAAGTLDLLAGAGFAAGAFTDNGALVLNGATFSATSLAMGAGGRISGSGAVAGGIGGGGTITASGGALALGGAVAGAETLDITAGSTLALSGAVSAASSIGFTGPAATLVLSQPGAVAAAIAGFAAGETIDLPGVAASGTTASLQGNALAIAEGGGGTLSLALAAGTSGTANAASDGSGGTRITLGPANLQISPMVFVGTAAPPVTTAGSAAALDGSTIAHLGFGDRIDVTDFSPAAAALSFLPRGSTEDITIASGALSTTLHLGGLYAASAFLLGADGHGGTMVTYAPPDA